ncbi:MAG: SHOCT domain-containing protein [Oligoflexia bacterium]|nr:SHOCT domain-containing protein [Oligoflexia bacterium]
MRYIKLSILVALTFLLSSCGGGGSHAVYVNRSTTLGQELNDLQSALQKGVVTEDEYKEQRAKLLRGQDS